MKKIITYLRDYFRFKADELKYKQLQLKVAKEVGENKENKPYTVIVPKGLQAYYYPDYCVVERNQGAANKIMRERVIRDMRNHGYKGSQIKQKIDELKVNE